MPLKSGSSKKTIASNIKELASSMPGAARAKGIKTMMKRGMSAKEAKIKQAVAISYAKAGKSKKS